MWQITTSSEIHSYFINDIADDIQSLVRLFGNDSSLLFSSTNPLEVEDRLTLDHHSLDNWAKQWLVDFNPPKNWIQNVYGYFISAKHKPNTSTIWFSKLKSSRQS